MRSKNKPYRDANSYYQDLFNGKVYKIALSTPFTCPNRDGTKGVGGCIFCSKKGSGNFAADPRLSVKAQLESAKERVKGKFGREKTPRYLAYFQSFTSTYGPINVQKDLFFGALSDGEVVGLAIATRPDCLSEECLDLLSNLARIKPVFVELGLQTANEKTARLIHRCYDNEEFREATAKLRARAIPVTAHLILGLPGETHDDEIASLRFAVDCGVAGVKLQLLHVLKDTPLAEMPYTPLTLEEYVFRVVDLVRRLPKNIVVHRLTGDGDKKELIAPLWSADKKRVLGALDKVFRDTGFMQGDLAEID